MWSLRSSIVSSGKLPPSSVELGLGLNRTTVVLGFLIELPDPTLLQKHFHQWATFLLPGQFYLNSSRLNATIATYPISKFTLAHPIVILSFLLSCLNEPQTQRLLYELTCPHGHAWMAGGDLANKLLVEVLSDECFSPFDGMGYMQVWKLP